MNEQKIIIYTDNSGSINVEAVVKDETIWLTQAQMIELFNSSKANISEHIKNIFNEEELKEELTVRKFRTVRKEGNRNVSREINYYNLDMIIAVGYRVNSKQATKFRIWATKVLKEFIIKGFVLDDDRLRQAKTVFGKDYFDELLERVRSIRASERRIYQKITDIFAECSIDYDFTSEISKDFYATVQNKFHYAITGKTAAEIIYNKANANKAYMGLTTWKNAPNGRILKSDTKIAKNYLNEKEIKKLERTISTYFDYIENQIEIRKEENRAFTMVELAKSVNRFLEFNNFKILDSKGKISHKQALKKAEQEYDIFNKTQKIESDFDKFIKKIESK